MACFTGTAFVPNAHKAPIAFCRSLTLADERNGTIAGRHFSGRLRIMPNAISACA